MVRKLLLVPLLSVVVVEVATLNTCKGYRHRGVGSYIPHGHVKIGATTADGMCMDGCFDPYSGTCGALTGMDCVPCLTGGAPYECLPGCLVSNSCVGPTIVPCTKDYQGYCIPGTNIMPCTPCAIEPVGECTGVPGCKEENMGVQSCTPGKGSGCVPCTLDGGSNPCVAGCIDPGDLMTCVEFTDQTECEPCLMMSADDGKGAETKRKRRDTRNMMGTRLAQLQKLLKNHAASAPQATFKGSGYRNRNPGRRGEDPEETKGMSFNNLSNKAKSTEAFDAPDGYDSYEDYRAAEGHNPWGGKPAKSHKWATTPSDSGDGYDKPGSNQWHQHHPSSDKIKGDSGNDGYNTLEENQLAEGHNPWGGKPAKSHSWANPALSGDGYEAFRAQNGNKNDQQEDSNVDNNQKKYDEAISNAGRPGLGYPNPDMLKAMKIMQMQMAGRPGMGNMLYGMQRPFEGSPLHGLKRPGNGLPGQMMHYHSAMHGLNRPGNSMPGQMRYYHGAMHGMQGPGGMFGPQRPYGMNANQGTMHGMHGTGAMQGEGYTNAVQRPKEMNRMQMLNKMHGILGPNARPGNQGGRFGMHRPGPGMNANQQYNDANNRMANPGTMFGLQTSGIANNLHGTQSMNSIKGQASMHQRGMNGMPS